jgi:hypothetical protein
MMIQLSLHETFSRHHAHISIARLKKLKNIPVGRLLGWPLIGVRQVWFAAARLRTSGIACVLGCPRLGKMGNMIWLLETGCLHEMLLFP